MEKEKGLFSKKLDVVDKIYVITSLLLWITLVVAFVILLHRKDWFSFFLVILTAVLMLSPKIFERRYKIDIPTEFEIVIVLFMYASVFLGGVRGYYTYYWWWDGFLHTGSGVALGFIGFAIMYVLYKSDKIEARPGTIAFLAFCFALAMGALWEIFEFGLDQIFGTQMQETGLIDTMWDLIVDSVGALFASFIGYLYLRKGSPAIFDRVVRKFIRQNRALFRRNF